MSNKNQDFRNKKFANQKPQKAAKAQPSATAAKVKKENKQKNGFMLRPAVKKFLPLIYFLLFAVVAYFYLAVLNKNYLYSCQEHSIWVDSGEFFTDKMRYVGGFAQWLGCYLTQYFYHPWAGSLILIALWALIFMLTKSVCGISNCWSILALAPCVLLLISDINLGYWIYYMKLPGFWFTYTVAILIMLIGIYVCTLYKGWVRAVLVVLYVVGFFPLIGYWSLIGAMFIGFRSILESDSPNSWKLKDISRYVIFVLALAAVIFVPRYYYQQYTTGRVEDIYTAMLPLFQNDKYIEHAKRLPYIIISALPFIFSLLTRFWVCGKKSEAVDADGGKPGKSSDMIWCVATVLLAVAYYVCISYFNFDDKRYHAELKMYQSLENCDWQGALDASQEVEGAHTRQMIMMQNIALFHLGSIGDNMFKYGNMTKPPYVPSYKKDADKYVADLEKYKDVDPKEIIGDLNRDSLKVNQCNTAGPLLYFMYGKCNFATRWCIENGVEFSFRVDEYKNLIRCAMMTGEDKLAEKYINILRKTTFNKDWAEERQEMLRDKKKYMASEEYKCIRPMYDAFKNALDGDQGLVEMYLISYFCHMNNEDPKFQEATVAFALIQKDISLFWPRFFKYAELHANEPMPIHYQEAAYLFGQLEHQVDTSKMPFDQVKIKNRFTSFNNVTQRLMQYYGPQYKGNEAALTRKVGEECYSQFGDTYWWFYYFSRGVHTY